MVLLRAFNASSWLTYSLPRLRVPAPEQKSLGFRVFAHENCQTDQSGCNPTILPAKHVRFIGASVSFYTLTNIQDAGKRIFKNTLIDRTFYRTRIHGIILSGVGL